MKSHQRCHVLHPIKCLQKQYPDLQTHLAWESVSIAPFYRWKSWGPKRWGTSTGIMWYSSCWFLPNTFALECPAYWGTQNLHSWNNQKEIKWSSFCVFSSSTTLMTLGLKKSLGNSVRTTCFTWKCLLHKSSPYSRPKWTHLHSYVTRI